MWNEALVRNIPLLETYHSTIKTQRYEKGNLEDHHSGHRINPHGSPDGTRNHELHGPWTHRNLNLLRRKQKSGYSNVTAFYLLWTSQGLNLGPPDYESVALTN